MRHALVIAGGSGTRLWPMSRTGLPKQLIPFINGRSLLQVALDRLRGLVPADRQFICALSQHERVICEGLGGFPASCYIGEPTGRDTTNAIGLGAAVIALRDPDAVIAVFTADHVIEPIDQFQRIVSLGYEVAESVPSALVTFGITPTQAATGYGYLQLGAPISAEHRAFTVDKFKEKPDRATAESYLAAGAERYLWNSGMFIGRASTWLDCIRNYEPASHAGLMRIAQAWNSDRRQAVLSEVYQTLKKISIDFGVMEPASRDPRVKVVAVPMPLTWLDVGSWPSFGQTREPDAQGNRIAAERHALVDTRNTLVASSDPSHVISTLGVEDLIVIHTPDATLVCRADRAEEIKKLHGLVGERFGPTML